jgi:uncharacterized protein YndB with AHSA1/START domain
MTAMRLDRWFAPPVEDLWGHLTEAELLDRWLVHGRVEAVPEGRVEMTVADEPGNAFDGTVGSTRRSSWSTPLAARTASSAGN